MSNTSIVHTEIISPTLKDIVKTPSGDSNLKQPSHINLETSCGPTTSEILLSAYEEKFLTIINDS